MYDIAYKYFIAKFGLFYRCRGLGVVGKRRCYNHASSISTVDRKRRKIGGTKVWRIWRIVLFSPIAQISLIYIHICNFGWIRQTFFRQTDLWRIRQTLVPPIFCRLQYMMLKFWGRKFYIKNVCKPLQLQHSDILLVAGYKNYIIQATFITTQNLLK